MNRIKIAVLDSGIAEEIKDYRIVYKKQFYWDYLEGKVKTNSNAVDYNGHGTACVDTILSICPYVDIYIIKILGISGMTSGKVLMKALRNANNLGVHLIVLAASIVGINSYTEQNEICEEIKI